MRSTTAIERHVDADLPLTPSSAFEWVATRALLPTPVGRVGLELEGHSVDLLGSGARPSWDRIEELRGRLRSLPAASQVSIEPGGQLEVSTTPLPDSRAAVDALRRDHATARTVMAELGLGWPWSGRIHSGRRCESIRATGMWRWSRTSRPPATHAAGGP